MSQPVKLSDGLVLDARLAGQLLERSIAGQVEFWARLGRAIDQSLQGNQVLALCRNQSARPLSALLDSVDSSEGRQRVTDFLQEQPFPHYRPHPDLAGALIRTAADGREVVGRFVNREFQPIRTRSKARRR